MAIKSAKVGLSDLHYAILTSDDETGVFFESAIPFAGSIEAKVTTESNEANEYSDDVLSDTAYGAIKVTVELTQKDVDLETQAALLGHTMEGDVLPVDGDDTQPFVAIGFKALKNNGKYRYVWLLKGKFAEVDESAKSKTATAELQTQILKGTFGATTYKFPGKKSGRVMRKSDEDLPAYLSSTGANWFTNGPSGTVDATSPTVTCVPADSATGVSVSANVVLTFSKAINTASLVIGESLIVQKADGTIVAGSGVWSGGNTVYTFDPTSNLSASTSYIATVTSAVKDLSGNKLAAANSFNFTTA